MLVFPQLTTGAIAQLPNGRTQQYRTAQVEMLGGTVYRLADPTSQERIWTLRLTDLNEGERTLVDQVFAAAEGRLRSFTFLDPNDNLLSYSADQSQSVWVKEPGLVLTAGQLDPFAGSNAVLVSNPTNGALRLYQNVAAPATYQYCLSMYLRSSAGGPASVMLGTLAQPATPSPGTAIWSRNALTGAGSTAADSFVAGIELPPLSEVVVYGAQLEPGPSMTSYKQTGAIGGVYSKCRFVSDGIQWVTSGLDEHSVLLEIATVR